MRLILTILEGPDARTARPLVTTEDPELIQAVARELSRRLEGAPPGAAELKLLSDATPGRTA